jgi:hypothetical protein
LIEEARNFAMTLFGIRGYRDARRKRGESQKCRAMKHGRRSPRVPRCRPNSRSFCVTAHGRLVLSALNKHAIARARIRDVAAGTFFVRQCAAWDNMVVFDDWSEQPA